MEDIVEFVQHEQDGVTVLVMKGRLDSNTSPDFETEVFGIIRSGGINMVIDLAGVDYVSSAGLRVFLKITKEIKQAGGKFALCSMKEYIREIFDMSGFALFIPIHAGPEESVQALLK